MINFRDVTKKYQVKTGTLVAVNHANLTIQDGEIYGIIGYSGAGKSTLVKMLNGLEKPTSGDVEVNGKNIANLNRSQLREQRQRIGTIFQHFNLLWSRTIIGNVMLPMEIAGVAKAKRKKRAIKLLKLVGLANRAHDYPSELSGGQKQRVGIARALANSPQILISDEATSALDPDTTDQILELLLKINHQMGLTIILITHEMHAVRKIANRVAVMDSGSIVEKGPVVDVFNHPKRAITKRFVTQTTSDTHEVQSTIQQLIKKDPHSSIVKLKFTGGQSRKPVVSRIIRQFPQLKLSIIGGNIEPVRDSIIGYLTIQLSGIDEKRALNHFQHMKIETEVVYRG
ncbi:methionine ABC transporter ATP-binding protein [Acetilactobacillus jinshanensis]|uniref:Methionine ABC transporter ATP-binding protein n=1 Tax=Acetilactobacillus jinshanensis TaxID=1720083 RepID=A0A4P6ZLR5_9LACO|nr:methionine ABC transporter ATP-binding protein [Acetilactobacillus jinshanensis]QBP18766.1 methionine ABC transporter ATP-binding protein [Acetilactobacillus jinshanensis]URL61637.1 methionine ABC transporter ATP-binding protein [uncultured bacterium]